MSSNGFLGLSPANPASKMHMPSPFERLDTGPWLDGLLEKIARGRERPPSPSPTRSPSLDRQDDVFGHVDESANISQAHDDMEAAGQDHKFEDDLFGEEGNDEEEEEERGDDELLAGHYQAEHIDTAAAGSLPSSVLENALRNTEQYSLYEDEVEKASAVLSMLYVSRLMSRIQTLARLASRTMTISTAIRHTLGMPTPMATMTIPHTAPRAKMEMLLLQSATTTATMTATTTASSTKPRTRTNTRMTSKSTTKMRR